MRILSHHPVMAIDDLKGVEVASGTYLYDGAVPYRVCIVARNHDVQWSIYEADGLLQPEERPADPGPDGLYYYVSGTGPFLTIADAKAWTEQSWGPIRWDQLANGS